MNSRSLPHLVTESGFLAFIGLAMNSAAQNVSLAGVVKDAQGGIVPNTVIRLVDLGAGRADVVISVTGTASGIEVSAAGVSAVDTESSYVSDVIGRKQYPKSR